MKKLFDHLTFVVQSTDAREWRRVLQETYSQFQLLSGIGSWAPFLSAGHQQRLFPENDLEAELLRFVDEVRRGLGENPYFMEFVAEVPADTNLLNLSAPDQAQDHIKYLLAYGFALDRLNILEREDCDFLEAMINHCNETRKKNGFYRLTNLLAMIKLHSIQLPVVRFLAARRKGKLSPDFGKYILSFNIFEATLVDLAVGLFDNARSTLPLIFFSPNYRGLGFLRKYQKGQPSEFSSDGKALLLTSPGQKEWSDLYQVWNMAFVSQFDQAPYLLAKLMIPSVSRYTDRPSEYMHTRITALHLAMNFLDSALVSPRISLELKHLGALDKELIRKWGKVNRRCAHRYVSGITKT